LKRYFYFSPPPAELALPLAGLLGPLMELALFPAPAAPRGILTILFFLTAAVTTFSALALSDRRCALCCAPAIGAADALVAAVVAKIIMVATATLVFLVFILVSSMVEESRTIPLPDSSAPPVQVQRTSQFHILGLPMRSDRTLCQ
jgi:hypothetical protein